MATQKEISIHLDLSERRVRGLIASGILPASKGPGGNSVDVCRFAYIRYLRGVSSGRIKEESDGEDSQTGVDKLIEEEKYRKIKRENDLAEKNIAPVIVLENALKDAARQIIPLLDGLPIEMKRDNPELTGADIQTAKTSIAKCRNLIAGLELVIEDDN